VYILKELIEEQGENVEKVKKGLYGIDGRVGTAGNLTIDKNGDPVFEYVVKAIRNGEVIEMK